MFFAMKKWFVALFILILLSTSLQAQFKGFPVLRWHPVDDVIGIFDGYNIYFYTSELTLLKQIAVVDPEQNVAGDIRFSWSPDGTRVALRFSSNLSPEPNGLQVWEFSSGRKIAEMTDIEPETNFSWSPDGTKIAAVHTRGRQDLHMVIYDAANGKPLADVMPNYVTGYISGFGWINETKLAIAMLNEWQVWDIPTQQPVMTLVMNPYSENAEHNASLTRFAFVAEPANTIQIWRTDTFEPVMMLNENTRGILDFRWQNNHIASTGYDGKIRIWDADNGQLLSEIQAGVILKFDLSPDGSKLIIFDETETISVRDSKTGAILTQMCESCEQSHSSGS